MRANAGGIQGPEREAFKVQFGDFSNESLAAIAQNITERLWMDEDDFQVGHKSNKLDSNISLVCLQPRS